MLDGIEGTGVRTGLGLQHRREQLFHAGGRERDDVPSRRGPRHGQEQSRSVCGVWIQRLLCGQRVPWHVCTTRVR